MRLASITSLCLLFTVLAITPACNEKPTTITGTVTLSTELLKTLKPTAVLYLIARRPGQLSGPPVAVKRFPQPILFPVAFTFSAQDAMMPDSPFEGQLTLSARVAQSGAATPPSPGDIDGNAPQAETAVGAKDVEIKLTHVR